MNSNQDIQKSVLHTGTTTVGVVTKEGIVIGADKRVSYGGDSGVAYIARNTDKVLFLRENILVTTAGTVSEAQYLMKLVKAESRIKVLRDKKSPSVKETSSLFAHIMFQRIRQPAMIPALAHFLIAGFEEGKVYLFDVTPDGVLEEIFDYRATGSGMMQINPVLDNEWKQDMSLKEGISLVEKCLKTSPKRDPASGDGLDVFTITKEGIKQVSNLKAQAVYTEQ